MNFTKKAALIATIALVLLSSISTAHAAANCSGTVKFALKFPTQCEGRLAFSLNDGAEKFFCTQDNTEVALVLTAQASGAEMLIRLADSSLTACTQNTVQYTTPRYMIVTSAE